MIITFLNVVVRKGTAILKLLASEDQSLLVWRDSLLILNFSFNILDSVTGLDLKGDGLTSKGLHEDLHVALEKDYNFRNVSEKTVYGILPI